MTASRRASEAFVQKRPKRACPQKQSPRVGQHRGPSSTDCHRTRPHREDRESNQLMRSRYGRKGERPLRIFSRMKTVGVPQQHLYIPGCGGVHLITFAPIAFVLAFRPPQQSPGMRPAQTTATERPTPVTLLLRTQSGRCLMPAATSRSYCLGAMVTVILRISPRPTGGGPKPTFET